MESKFIFVRHGQSQANAAGMVADAHSPLTEKGIEQARKTANEVRGFKITLIASSPCLRAQQTAEIIAGELGIDVAQIKTIEELKERSFGALENNPKNQESEWYFTSEDKSQDIEERSDLFKRMEKCFSIIKKIGANENVLVVGHAVSGFYLLQIASAKESINDFDSPSQMNNADFIAF